MNENKPNGEFYATILKNAFETDPQQSSHPIEDEDFLLRWSSGGLTEEEHQNLLHHLALCSDCRKETAIMIKNGILEFTEISTKSFPQAVCAKKRTYHPVPIIGGVMTSALCILFSLFFLYETPETPQVAFNANPQQNVSPETKLRGETRSLENETPKYALLIGINRYEKLPPNEWLDGCHNDIEEIKSVITERFGFDTRNVTTLFDEQATAKGIRTELKKLTEKVQARSNDAVPAQVVLYFSGHGSQTLDQPEGDPDCDSADGLDSTLVVYDSEKQGSDTDIRDDELNKFSHEICKDGKANLLICLDSCHSGGGARGITKFRGISRDLNRPIPNDLVKRKFTPKSLPDETVFLSACQSNQKEPEYEQDGKKYGLFSYHLVKLLRSKQIVSSLDYLTLRDAIYRSYQRNKVAQSPTPTVEGNVLTLKKPVLGADLSLDQKPYWSVSREGNSRDTLRMEAGRINDITKESLFELYETVEQAIDPNATSLGWFSVHNTEGKHSLGQFFKWNDSAQTERIDTVLPNGFNNGFAVERYHNHGDNTLSVRLVDAATDATLSPEDGVIPDSVRFVLCGEGTQRESKWIHWSGENENCDIVIKFDEKTNYATIFPAVGCAEDDLSALKTRGESIPETLQGGWGPIEWGTERGKTELVDMLQRIMKGISLKRLVAEKSEQTQTRGSGIKPILETEILRIDGDGQPEKIAVDTTKGLVLTGGENDWYRLRIKNNDTKPFHVTILCVDPNMQIASFAFGIAGEPPQFDPIVGAINNPSVNRLEADEEFVSDFGFEAPFGMHTLIVLATREPSDFSYLAQEGLPGTAKGRGTKSDVEKFLEDQFTVGTRSIRQKTPPRDDAWSVGSVEAIVEPEK